MSSTLQYLFILGYSIKSSTKILGLYFYSLDIIKTIIWRHNNQTPKLLRKKGDNSRVQLYMFKVSFLFFLTSQQ